MTLSFKTPAECTIVKAVELDIRGEARSVQTSTYKLLHEQGANVANLTAFTIYNGVLSLHNILMHKFVVMRF